MRDGIRAATAAADGSKVALIIDDDAGARNLMDRWLRRLGYVTLCADSGAIGIELARRHPVSIVVLDIMMPVMSGYDVLRVLRDDARLAHVPVIVASVFEDRLRGLQLGADEWIVKPVSPTALSAILDVYGSPGAGDVVVVGGDPASGDAVARTAVQIGLSARRAEDFDAAIAMICRQRPAAIVISVDGPEDGNRAMLATLAADESLRDIPVVVIAARAETLADLHGIRREGVSLLHKAGMSPHQVAISLREAMAR